METPSGSKIKSEDSYDEIQKAINNDDGQEMRKIIADQDYKINGVGGSEKSCPSKHGKLAILIANYNYKRESGWAKLPGAKQDLDAMRSKLSSEGYEIEVIENSEDMLGDIENVMTKTPDHSVNLLQVLYVGKLKILLKQI